MITHLKTIEKQISETVIVKLEYLLEKAKAGEIAEIVVIYKCTDGTWDNKMTETMHFSEWIGRLERTKFEWLCKSEGLNNE